MLIWNNVKWVKELVEIQFISAQSICALNGICENYYTNVFIPFLPYLYIFLQFFSFCSSNLFTA